jgi:carboxymethylenebutenolidase
MVLALPQPVQPPMSTMLPIPTFDGHVFNAYCARPEHSSAPAIIVCQEIFGVNAAMRAICDDLARQGYLALCPDLFWRLEPGIELTDKTEAAMEKAFAFYNAFDVEQGVSDLLATVAAARKHEVCNGAIGTVGYCLGGKLAYLLMSRTDVDCGVSYYGVGLEDMLHEVSDIRRPLLMHMAAKDRFVSPEAQAKIMRSVAKNPSITVVTYPNVDHAFARPNGVHFNMEAAMQAHEHTAKFFSAHLTR